MRRRGRKRCDFVLADVRIPLDLIKSRGGRPTGAPPTAAAAWGQGRAGPARRREGRGWGEGSGHGAAGFFFLFRLGLVYSLLYSSVCPGGCEKKSERKEGRGEERRPLPPWPTLCDATARERGVLVGCV